MGAMNAAIEQAINIVGTQEELARLANVTQATISVLKNGRAGKPVVPRFATAKRLSDAVGGQIAWHEFMEIEQGDSEKESTDECEGTTGAGDITPVTTRNGGQVAPPVENRRGTHSGAAPVAH